MRKKAILVMVMMTLFAVPNSTFAGQIMAWGNNSSGQLNTPADVNDVIAIVGFDEHSLAIRADGSLIGWGDNSHGQGDVPEGNDFIAVAAGSFHSLALKSDGSLIAWGDNEYGKCDVPDGNDFIAIAAGGHHSVALKSNGSIVAWGKNDNGQCNAPSSNDFTAVACGGAHSIALKTDGSLAAWGWNGLGQCDVPTGDWFVAIAAGTYHNIALKTDNSLAAWGRNTEGQCNVPIGWDFTDIAAGYIFSLALKSDDSLVMWGSNDHGLIDNAPDGYFALIDAGYMYALAVTTEPTAPPDANANGPYTVYVGDMLTLDGSGSTDADDDIVSFLWDLDDNGSFETDAGGDAIFDVSYAYLQSLGLLIDYTYTIHLKVTDSEGQSDIDDSTLTIIPKPALQVTVDIKPTSCPNPMNVKSSGVLPAAILGTEVVDAITIDPTSIQLAGVDAIRSNYEDVAAPVSDPCDCNCTTEGPDGFLDLTVKFETQEIVEAIGEVNDGDVLPLTLTGVLFGERPIEGVDCILVRGKYKPFNKADINKDGVVDLRDFSIFAENWLKSSIVED